MEQTDVMCVIFPQEPQKEVTSHHQDDKLVALTSMKYLQQRQTEQMEVPKREYVNFNITLFKHIFILKILIYRNVEKETSSNFIAQKSTHHTDFLKSCAGLFNNKNSLDSSTDPMQLGATLLSFNEVQVR